ncbi:hypothetical protein L204_105366 [Cryptococcus depauperatus]
MATQLPVTGDGTVLSLGTPPESGVPSSITTSGGGRNRGRDGKEKESFACLFPGCGQTYSRMEYLKRHQRKHQDDRPFQCKDCSKSFARSDVLLRHRRRCHPTPPPVDCSTSPPAHGRIYNGMPVSSSRMDAREASPPRNRSRKHARPSEVEKVFDRQRTRIDPALRDEFDNEGNNFEEREYQSNGLEQYYGAAGEEHPNYSGEFMPSFDKNPAYHSLNPAYHSLSDPNHLEDASVLLSMAYPGGVPGNEDSNQEARDMPDWANNPTINLIMETAVANQIQDAERTSSPLNNNSVQAKEQGELPASVVEVNGTATATVPVDGDIDPRLQADSGPVDGDFLNTMSWLSGMDTQGVLKTGLTPESSQWKVARSPKANSFNSTFNIPSCLSSLNLNVPAERLFLNGNHMYQEDQNESSTPNGLNILEQLAQMDIPQTAANPNPERPLLRVDHAMMILRAGEEYDRNSRFYLPADWFAGCYQVSHWALPPIKTLSVMACHTFHTVLNHFSFVHFPTFTLTDTAACLAFAICTVGGIRNGGFWEKDTLLWCPTIENARPAKNALDGPVIPDQSWESLYEESWQKCNERIRAVEAKNVANWKRGSIVRSEKTNMLVKSFTLAKGVLMTEYNVALLQTLILYHAPNFLSEDETERMTANISLGTIINITRQIGFFSQEADHIQQDIRIPVEPFTPNELNRCWREWIQMESRRRTAFLVYQLDTISSLESNLPRILSSCEVAYIPLPAPDTLWKAPTAQVWYKALKNYQPMTLDEAMRRVFFLPTYGSFDKLHEKADTQYYNLLNQSDYGPFARMAMVITLLRGIIDIGEGKRDKGDWRDLTDLWVGCPWLRPSKKMLAQDGTDLGIVTRGSLKERFKSGLQKWREGWDFDSLCSTPTQVNNTAGTNGIASPEDSPELPNKDEEELPKGTLNYCEDALPLYWLAQGLLNILCSDPNHEAGENAFSGLPYRDMLKSSRTFTRTGEGVPVNNKVYSASIARDGRNSSMRNHTGPSTSSSNNHLILPTPSSIPSTCSSGNGDLAQIIPSANANVAELSILKEGMSDGTMAGIMHALSADSEDLGLSIGLNLERSQSSADAAFLLASLHPETDEDHGNHDMVGLTTSLPQQFGFTF